jgi:hypothetical protein
MCNIYSITKGPKAIGHFARARAPRRATSRRSYRKAIVTRPSQKRRERFLATEAIRSLGEGLLERDLTPSYLLARTRRGYPASI